MNPSDWLAKLTNQVLAESTRPCCKKTTGAGPDSGSRAPPRPLGTRNITSSNPSAVVVVCVSHGKPWASMSLGMSVSGPGCAMAAVARAAKKKTATRVFMKIRG
eukprot:Amastigsp_a682861_11.p3 type:complete len:104 gc:universal Amastigsp_a682861_11:365-54(-)